MNPSNHTEATMRMKYFLLVLGTLFVFSSSAQADAPLKSKLGLSMDQAKQVHAIQKKYRQPFSAKRQELHRERRKLRRARNANESRQVAQQEQIAAKLQDELQHIRRQENEEIRRLLTPDQRQKFEEVLQQRKASVGSSRDARDL